MKIQVNSDNTVAVDASLTRSVKTEVMRFLGRFAPKVTRVEVHLSDIDKTKNSPADKRCLIEARPAGSDPRTASANTNDMATAVDQALKKMQRLLTTFFGKHGRTPVEMPGVLLRPKSAVHKKAAVPAKKTVVAKKKLSAHGPKKKMVFQARRKSWPKAS
jgi:ribosome-associated translation inhibitor RaiA